MRKQPRKASKLVTRELVMASIENLPEMGTQWLWPQRIAMDSVTLLVGEPGVGKSALAAEIAARVSSGAAWPDGKPNAGAGGVMLFNANEHLIRKVRPALRAAGADLSRFNFPYLTAEKQEDDCDIEEVMKPINLKRDLGLLAQALDAAPGCKLVIIDPFMAFMGSGRGADNPDMVSVLRTLHNLAVQYHVAILVVTHLREGTGPAKSRVVGGEDLMTMARAIWMVAEGGGRKPGVGGQKSEIGGQRSEVGGQKSEVRGEKRLLLEVKNNMAPQRTGLAFEFMQEAKALAPRVVWSSETVEMTADEMLRELRRKTADSTSSPAVEKAKEFLQKVLAGGPRLVKELEMEAKQGWGISYASLQRARIELKVEAIRKQGAWWICLKEDEAWKTEPTRAVEGVEVVVDIDGFGRLAPRPQPLSPEYRGEGSRNRNLDGAARVECLGEKSGFGSRNAEVKEPTVAECVARVERLGGVGNGAGGRNAENAKDAEKIGGGDEDQRSEVGGQRSEVAEESVARVECLAENAGDLAGLQENGAARVECLGAKSEVGSQNWEVKEQVLAECVARVECLEGVGNGAGGRNAENAKDAEEMGGGTKIRGQRSEVRGQKWQRKVLRVLSALRKTREIWLVCKKMVLRVLSALGRSRKSE